MDRFILTDAQWETIERIAWARRPILGEREEMGGCSSKPFCGSRGPAALGVTCRRSSGLGTFKRIFDAVSDDPDMEYAMVDATIVKVHRHGQGAKGGLKARP